MFYSCYFSHVKIHFSNLVFFYHCFWQNNHFPRLSSPLSPPPPLGQCGKSEFVADSVKWMDQTLSLLPPTALIYVGHQMSQGYREKLENVANYLKIPLSICLGGLQSKRFSASWRKKLKDEAKQATKRSTVQVTDEEEEQEVNDLKEDNEDDEEVEEDKDNEEDRELAEEERDRLNQFSLWNRKRKDESSSIQSNSRSKRGRNGSELKPNPKLGTAHKLTKFLSQSYENSLTGGKMLTRSALKRAMTDEPSPSSESLDSLPKKR